jgi:hypothetical protein
VFRLVRQVILKGISPLVVAGKRGSRSQCAQQVCEATCALIMNTSWDRLPKNLPQSGVQRNREAGDEHHKKCLDKRGALQYKKAELKGSLVLRAFRTPPEYQPGARIALG